MGDFYKKRICMVISKSRINVDLAQVKSYNMHIRLLQKPFPGEPLSHLSYLFICYFQLRKQLLSVKFLSTQLTPINRERDEREREKAINITVLKPSKIESLLVRYIFMF